MPSGHLSLQTSSPVSGQMILPGQSGRSDSDKAEAVSVAPMMSSAVMGIILFSMTWDPFAKSKVNTLSTMNHALRSRVFLNYFKFFILLLKGLRELHTGRCTQLLCRLQAIFATCPACAAGYWFAQLPGQGEK